MSVNENKYFTEALAHIESGEPVAIPTETVYGLAARIDHPLAIRQVFALKNRPVNHPLIIHVSSLRMAEQYAHFSEIARQMVKKFWPGPLTIILPKKESVPFLVTGGLSTVGIRSPNHPLTLQLIKKIGVPLAAPSANQFGKISPTKAEHVIDDFDGNVPVLDGGLCTIGLESTIVDLSTENPAIRRLGAITEEEIIPIVGKLGQSNTIAPGTLKAHYAPSTSLLLSSNVPKDAQRLQSQGLSIAILSIEDPNDYAKQLYSELRRLDKLKVDVLIAKKPNSHGIGKAIIDRLTRASYGSRKE